MSSEAETETGPPPWLEPPLPRWLRDEQRYVLVRACILRSLGAVYVVAFLSFARQGIALVGAHGILPAETLLGRLVAAHHGSRLDAFRRLPTLFLATGASDAVMLGVAWAGVVLGLAMVWGATNAFVTLAAWALYLSIVHVGQTFYSFGWEIQLLETGLLAVFLCPLRTLAPGSAPPPSPVVIWLFRWLIARIMLGAGLIKLRGDPCWRDLTCLAYHFETQPNPGPLSRALHELPGWYGKGGVLANHLVEVVAPFFAFGPRLARLAAGCLFVSFQGFLILSGNLSFLNWLTIVPALACFDDDALARVLPARIATAFSPSTGERSRVAKGGALVLAIVVAFLSIEPIQNLLSPRQRMNSSYNPLRFVNTYGAFGGITRERIEVVLEGTWDSSGQENWKEYVLPCKPGPVDRRPCWVTPYHHRLDWQMWFLPFGDPEDQAWLVSLVDRLLEHEPSVRKLFTVDPFASAPPRCVRAVGYRYTFAKGATVWHREPIGTHLAPLCKGDPWLDQLLVRHGLRARSAQNDSAIPPAD